MIRLYVDWNVMSQMKAGAHSDFSKIVSDDKKFFNVFSTSHIGDIAASDQGELNRKHIEADLEYIQKITQGYCVLNTGSEVVIEQRSALDIYKERTDLNMVSQFFEPSFLESFMADLDPQVAALVSPLVESLKSLPVEDVFRRAFEDPETAGQMRQFLPDLENNYNALGVLRSIFNMFRRLNETGDYKQLREIVQQGTKINRNRLFDTADPYSMIDKAYEKLGAELPPTPHAKNVGPKWYNDLVNEYIRLDMHGYQEDKISVDKGRKQTFRNTQEDASHAAFATTCDFYITNDDRNYKKAEALYQRQRINALVMKPDEFVKHYNDWLHFKDAKHVNIIPEIIKFGEPDKIDDKTSTYFGCFFIFDYFNKIQLLRGDKGYVLLSREKPTNDKCIYEKEINVLIEKLFDVFGKDLENKGDFGSSEIDSISENSWDGRKWLHRNLIYHVKMVNGHLHLYIFSGK